jgi:hypothetical protein
VSPRDIGAAFAERFSPAGESSRVPELADWLAGRCGHRVLTRAQCARVRARREEALAFARGFALDPRSRRSRARCWPAATRSWW